MAAGRDDVRIWPNGPDVWPRTTASDGLAVRIGSIGVSAPNVIPKYHSSVIVDGATPRVIGWWGIGAMSASQIGLHDEPSS